MADEPTNRRGLLKALVRSAGQAFGEFTDAVNAGQEAAERAAPAPEPPPPPPELAQLSPVTRTLTMAELDDVLAEEGLAARGEAVRALVRPATRLTSTLGAGPNRSWIGRPIDGVPVDGFVAVAEIDLADPALADGPLAGTGRMRVTVEAPPDGPLGRCSRARVSVVPAPGDAPGRSVHLSTELTLPRVWAAPVQALALDDAEHAAYVRVRERVAELQGVTVEDGDAAGVARHHVLGYPTETSGTMPVTCELAARALDPDMPPADIPDDVLSASERWRLLLQVTHDAATGVTLGEGVERLYLWIADDRLEAQDFEEVWALAR